jgi:hypothetical protein
MVARWTAPQATPDEATRKQLLLAARAPAQVAREVPLEPLRVAVARSLEVGAPVAVELAAAEESPTPR